MRPLDPDGVKLGRQFLEELRHPHPRGNGPITRLLLGGARGVNHDVLFTAAVTAAELAADDGERWRIGDGLIDESIAVRDPLRRRWAAARTTNAAVAEVYRVMREEARREQGSDSWWLLDS